MSARLYLAAGCLSLLSISTYAAQPTPQKPVDTNSFYAGFLLGYGSTDWNQIACHNCVGTMNALALNGTPMSAEDTGFAWGLFVGYQPKPYFAIEGTFVRYKDAYITFSEFNLYPGNLTDLTSQTHSYSLVMKFLVPLARPNVKAFADAGMVVVHRMDKLANVARVGGSFGVGVMADLSQRVLAEMGFQFSTGFGKSEVLPANDYVPFIYIIYGRLGYRITV